MPKQNQSDQPLLRYNLLLHADTINALKAIAKQRRMSTSALVRHLLMQAVAQLQARDKQA